MDFSKEEQMGSAAIPGLILQMSVYYAEPVSDLLSAATASVLFLANIRKILSSETLEKIV